MRNELTPLATENLITWPTHEFEEILLACDPGEALKPDDPRHADLSPLRSGVGVRRLQNTLLQRKAPGKYHHCLLCGHRGSGKSTELLGLQQWANENGFLALWEQVDARFGMIDLDYSDLFLLAASMVDEGIGANERPLLVPKLRNILSWFHDITKEDEEIRQSEVGVEVGGQLGGTLPFSLGALFAKLTTGIKGTTKHTQKVRETIRRYPNALVNLTRDFLEEANRVVITEGHPKGLLLIFDNMDRYDPVQIDGILMRSSQQIQNMACHTVFTFPISLAYKPITGRVDYPTALLPMLALRSRKAGWKETVAASDYEEEQIDRVREMLARRVDLDTLFSSREDVRQMIRLSGGAVRDLIQLISLAATSTQEGDQITSEAVHIAVQELRGTYMRLLATTPQDYRCLANIAKRASVATAESNYAEAINRLLFNGCLLEYTEDGEPWYDIHPLLLETEELRHALRAA